MKRRVALVVVGAVLVGAGPPEAMSTRGIAGAVDVTYTHRLRAKPGQTPSSPVLVRIAPGRDAGTQRIEFIGTVSGEYDLREYIVREDGAAAADLPPMPVRIVSRLPPDHGTDLFGRDESSYSLSAHYREIMVGLAAIWLAVPAFVVVRRLSRRKVIAPPPVAVPVRTLADELREVLASASGPLSVAERGRLELLLLRYFREARGDAAAADLTVAVGSLREQEPTRGVVLAMERWLHGPGGGSDRAGPTEAAALDAVRAGLTPARAAEGTP
jgi:hypothetical protein